MHIFYARRSQKRKKMLELTVFFALLGSSCVKAACKMLMKFTPDDEIELTSFVREWRRKSGEEVLCSRVNSFIFVELTIANFGHFQLLMRPHVFSTSRCIFEELILVWSTSKSSLKRLCNAENTCSNLMWQIGLNVIVNLKFSEKVGPSYVIAQFEHL